MLRFWRNYFFIARIDKPRKKVNHKFGVNGQEKVNRGRNVHFYSIRTPSDLFLTFDPKQMIDFFSCLINAYKMSHDRWKSEQVLNFTLYKPFKKICGLNNYSI